MKKRIFLDTNIVIDYLANRQPFAEDAYQIFIQSEMPDIELCISALSFTTIYYVLRKECGHQQLLELLEKLRSLVIVLPTGNDVIKKALESKFSDFEDAVQYYTAIAGASDSIITRNVKDYTLSQIEVLTPAQFLKKS